MVIPRDRGAIHPLISLPVNKTTPYRTRAIPNRSKMARKTFIVTPYPNFRIPIESPASYFGLNTSDTAQFKEGYTGRYYIFLSLIRNSFYFDAGQPMRNQFVQILKIHRTGSILACIVTPSLSPEFAGALCHVSYAGSDRRTGRIRSNLLARCGRNRHHRYLRYPSSTP